MYFVFLKLSSHFVNLPSQYGLVWVTGFLAKLVIQNC
jgi:hypothetical protein